MVLWYYDRILRLQEVLRVCTFCDKPAWKAVLFIFRQHLLVQPWLMCLETGDIPILIFTSSDGKFGYDY